MARKAILDTYYSFTPSSRTIVFNQVIQRERFVLITNVTQNRVIYNFSDPNLTLTSHSISTNTITGVVTTTVVLNYNTTSMSTADKLQFLIDEYEERFMPAETYVDPANKFRVSTPQSLIDTDRAQRNYQQNLDAFTNKGLKAATIAAEKFATALERGSRALPGSPAGGRATTGTIGTTSTTTGTTPGGYLDKVKQVESGGQNIGALGGASSAFGHYQITKGTFEDLVKNAGPNSPLRGKTFADMQTDTALQAEAARQLTDQNRQFLASRKLPTSDPALYLAHFLGAGGAASVLSASDDTPIQYAVSTKALMQNQGVFGNMSTVGDLKAWADRKMGNVGYAAMGGIFSGPRSGFPAVLHGKEAVVPLPDGKTIPVDIRGGMTNPFEQILTSNRAVPVEIVRKGAQDIIDQLTTSNKSIPANIQTDFNWSVPNDLGLHLSLTKYTRIEPPLVSFN